ncbi:ABC transporter ATP-binding protein [Anthocerotibacter panamensis]|uniref:ABC transporter ATP-binding protein n=1 Tax=Anthocerotibacter panamensis TaxID=2857077 RepID=UPI001C4071A8|nr:ABC transporter ATP-binding protein [Anthocerotibacter panamensis]
MTREPLSQSNLQSVSPAPLIRLEGVSKTYLSDGVETYALAEINLDINPGEYVAITGPSGCGKSTLLSILGLLDTPSQGTYWLKDQVISTLSSDEQAGIRNREIGFIFQSFNLISDLTVLENVTLPLSYQRLGRSQQRKQAIEAIERVNMAYRLNYYPSQLSGGQQQRVAVARALAIQPSLILADEPTGNLDSKNGEQVMHLLDQLHQEGATICIVTHDPTYAGYARRTIRLLDGALVGVVSENGL